MIKVNENFSETGHNKQLFGVEHQIVHLARASYDDPIDDGCHTLYTQDDPSAA